MSFVKLYGSSLSNYWPALTRNIASFRNVQKGTPTGVNREMSNCSTYVCIFGQWDRGRGNIYRGAHQTYGETRMSRNYGIEMEVINLVETHSPSRGRISPPT